MPATNRAVPESEREIVVTRVIDASRERVFDAFTDPKQVGHWYGPNGFTITTHEMDVRPGGVWRFIMHAPDGTDFDNHNDYIEVRRPDRLVFMHGSRKDDPEAFHSTVTFTDQGGKTLVTMRLLFNTKQQKDHTVGFGAVELGGQTLSKLAAFVAAPLR